LTDIQKAAVEIESAISENREELRNAISTLADLKPQLEETMTNINAISQKINTGQGTLGMMVNDPSLYEDTKKAVNQVGESFEGGEEQGVIRSFFGILFGSIL